MRLKILAAIAVTMMCSMTFAGLANLPETDVQGTPETCISRVNPATDGTSCVLSGNICNGISYFWEQGEAFNPTVSVSTWGTNTKGIAVDAPGTWIYNTAYGQCSADAGTIWDVWAPGENAVQVYEVFNDQSVSGRNYTCIFEDQMEGDGSTNFGVNNAQNALTVINDPYVISQDVNTCVIGIAPQTTGFEVASLFDGYAVYKSVTGPITQTNLGTYLGDASLDGGVWKYTDFAQTQDTWYTVKVKWNGGTYAFYAPLHSYGMSENLYVDYYWEFPPFVENLAAGPNPHNGNVASEYVTISATITDWDINILSAEYRIDGSPWVMFPQTGVSPLPVSTLYYFPNGFSEGSHLLQARAFNGYTYGATESATFSIIDTTAPIAAWNSVPGPTSYPNQNLAFNAGYNDFRPYNPAVAASFFQYRVNNGTWTNVTWVNSSFAWGSYINTLTYTIPGNTFAAGDWVNYRGQLKDTATTPNTALLAQGSCQIVESPPHFDIPVTTGWNLISYPVVASGETLDVLDDNGGDTVWSVIKWYNPQTPNDPWKTYRIGGTANDLPGVSNRMGLWVYITDVGSDGQLVVDGDDPGTMQIELYSGWNLVGYPTYDSDTVANVFWGTGVDRVEVFDPAYPYIKAVGPTYVMTPGNGYWVHTNSDSIWTVDNGFVQPSPYVIFGNVYLYDGTYSGGYSPIPTAGLADVNVTWWDSNNTRKSVLCDTTVSGSYSVEILDCTDGGVVYLNSTFEAPYSNKGYNYTIINKMIDFSHLNVVCGVPYSMRVTSPLNQSFHMIGVPFMVTYEIRDIDGKLCKGYFTHSDGPMRWNSGDILFTPPHGTYFNGTIGPTPGTRTDLLTSWTWGNPLPYQWFTISEGGLAGSNDYLTPWGEFYLDPYNQRAGWLTDLAKIYLLIYN